MQKKNESYFSYKKMSIHVIVGGKVVSMVYPPNYGQPMYMFCADSMVHTRVHATHNLSEYNIIALIYDESDIKTTIMAMYEYYTTAARNISELLCHKYTYAGYMSWNDPRRYSEMIQLCIIENLKTHANSLSVTLRSMSHDLDAFK